MDNGATQDKEKGTNQELCKLYDIPVTGSGSCCMNWPPSVKCGRMPPMVSNARMWFFTMRAGTGPLNSIIRFNICHKNQTKRKYKETQEGTAKLSKISSEAVSVAFAPGQRSFTRLCLGTL